jgi:hypothetical protein
MSRLYRVGALSLLMCALGALHASASSLLADPIVRTRGGGGSIQIFELPFTFDFGVFPIAPDLDNCTSGPDTEFPELTAVSCSFQNLTGFAINDLDFRFVSPTGDVQLTLEDTSGFFPDRFPPDGTFASAAHFSGAGVPSGFCGFEGPCTGGEFAIDLVGFPDGTTAVVTMDATTVPEPASLLLLGTGLAIAARGRRRFRR